LVSTLYISQIAYKLLTFIRYATRNQPPLVKREMLNRCQFGVNSKGGVEPVVRLVERALAGKTGDRKFVRITSLDFKNAFNTMLRRFIASGVKLHAKILWRAACWAYNNPTHLIIPGADPDDPPLLSTEGSRQGDPFGPFLFSIAYRSIVEKLQRELGDDFLVVAYLDDTYVLSTRDEDPLPTISKFFERDDCKLELNLSKCKTTSFADIRKNGMEILGTCVGPESARRRFLGAKVDSQIAKLERLSLLTESQHQLLLFRQCYQQDLRHLQRTLDTSDLGDVWDRLDAAYSKIIINARASQQPGPFDSDLITLPAKMGGMGILSHKECSPHARAAAMQAADTMLVGLLDEAIPDGVGDERVDARSQGQRCTAALEIRRDCLMEKMEDKERKCMVESGSVLGRRWLTSIPWNESSRLSNFEISTALHYRLVTNLVFICDFCGHEPELGHDECCTITGRPRYTITRHNRILRAVGDALDSIQGVRVEIEPATTEHGSKKRNDLRVFGSNIIKSSNTEHDVKVYSLLADKARKTTGQFRDGALTSAPKPNSSLWDIALHQSNRYLYEVATEARKKAPAGIGKFDPLVFSTGGIVEKDTWAVLEGWKREVNAHTWGYMLRRMSMALVKTRADTLAKQRVDEGLDEIELEARAEMAKKKGKRTKAGSGEVVVIGAERDEEEEEVSDGSEGST
jgi:hypothetical protein